MKKLRRKIRKLFTNRLKVYNNIEELPFWNYDKAENDLRYLFILKSYNNLPKKYDKEKLKNTWDSINMQVVEYTGFSNEQKAIMSKEKEIEMYKIKLALKIDVDTIRFKRALEQLDYMVKINNSQLKIDIEEKIVNIEKYMKISINPKKISVKKWIAYVKSYQKYCEMVEKSEKKHQK